MSGIFSRVDVITIAQQDAECRSPTVFIRPAPPAYLRPKKDKVADDDPSSTGSYTPDLSRKTNDSDWLSKIPTRDIEHEAIIARTRNKEERILAIQCKIKPGYYVYTRHKLIAQLSKRVRNKRKFRLPMYGTVSHRSIYQPRFWLVKFRNGVSFYCTEKVLKLVDTVSPSHELTTSKKDKKLCITKVNYSFSENQEYFMRIILCSKVHPIPGHPVLSFKALYELFRHHHSWLTIGKLKYYAKKLELEDEETEEDTWFNRSFDFIDYDHDYKITNEEDSGSNKKQTNSTMSISN